MIFNNALCYRTALSDICRLQTADYRLQTTDYSLQTADYRLQTTDYRLQRGTKTVDYTEEKMTEDRWPQILKTGQSLIQPKSFSF